MKKLWSPKSIHHNKPQSSLLNRKYPSFKLSQNVSYSTLRFPSAFYSGRVQYGGAMSACRRCLTFPYVIPKIIKLKHKTGQLHNSVNKKMNTTLSSTSQKIFKTLEKMSTPFEKSNKFPVKPLGVTATIGDHQDIVQVDSFSKDSLCRPIPFQCKQTVPRYLIPSAGVAEDEPGNSETSQSFTVYRGQPAVLAALSSSSTLNLKKFTESSSDRSISSIRNAALHSSKDDEEIETANISDNPSIVSPLPKIKHYKPGRTSAAFSKIISPNKSNKKKRSNSTLEPVYTFSPPAKISFKNTSTLAGKRPHSNSSQQVNKRRNSRIRRGSKNSQRRIKLLRKQVKKSLKQHTFPILKCYGTKNDKPCARCPRAIKYTQSLVERTVGDEETSSVSESLSIQTFAKATWQCSVCSVENTDDLMTCSACHSPRDSLVKRTVVDEETSAIPESLSMQTFAKATWQCSVCSVENTDDLTACSACHSPRDGTNKIQPIASHNFDKWTCNVCLVENNQKRLSCEACQTPRPREELLEETQATELDLPPWECHVCMVWNEENTEKCKACGTLMPGLRPLGKVKSTESAKWQCDSCLVFNDAKMKQCVVCKALKPGAERSPSLTHVSSAQKFSINDGTFGEFTNEKFILFGSATSQSKASNMQQLSTFGTSKTKTGAVNETKNVTSGTVEENSTQEKNSKKVVEMVSIPSEKITLGYVNSEKSKSAASTLAKSNFQDKKSGSTWECQVCLVLNDKERTKCVACESPQPKSEDDLISVKNKSTFQYGNTSSSVFQFGIQNTEKAKLLPSPKHITSTPLATTAEAPNWKSFFKGVKQKPITKDPSLVSFLPSSTSHAFSSSAFKFGNTTPSYIGLSEEDRTFKAGFPFQTDSTMKGKSSSAVEKTAFQFGSTPASFSTVPGTKGFSVAKLDENAISSTVQPQQANAEENQVAASIISSKQIVESTANIPVTQAPFSFSQQLPSTSKEDKSATGFKFQLSATQAQPIPDNFASESTSHGFSFGPRSRMSAIVENSASQELKNTAAASNEHFTGFSGFRKQKFDHSSTQTGFPTFGMHKAEEFAKNNALPKPQFSFKNAAHASSQTENSHKLGNLSTVSQQSQTFTFGASKSTNFGQPQNRTVYKNSQSKNVTFGSNSTDTPKPSGLFQFSSSQTTHAARTPPHGFTFANTVTETNNPAPSAGFNFSTAMQNFGQSKFTGQSFQFSDESQIQFQAKPNSTCQFSAGSQPPFPQRQDLSRNNDTGALFHIGQSSDSKKASLQARPIKQAKRRLRPNKN